MILYKHENNQSSSIHQHELASGRCGGGEVLEGMIVKLFNCKPI